MHGCVNKVISGNRVAKFIAILGITLILVSLLGEYTIHFEREIPYGEFKGPLFKAGGRFYIDVDEEEGKPFSLFIFPYNELLTIFENGSIDSATPLVLVENVTEFSSIIEILSPGVYGALVIPMNSGSITPHVRIVSLFLKDITQQPGIILMFGGILYLSVVFMLPLVSPIKNHETDS